MKNKDKEAVAILLIKKCFPQRHKVHKAFFFVSFVPLWDKYVKGIAFEYNSLVHNFI